MPRNPHAIFSHTLPRLLPIPSKHPSKGKSKATELSVTSTSPPQWDFSPLGYAIFPAATTRHCLPFLRLLPQLLLKTLRSWGRVAQLLSSALERSLPSTAKMLWSRGNNSARIIGAISYKRSQPARNPNAREGRASTEERLKLAAYTLTRQICFFFLTLTLQKANILAH